MIPSSHLLDQHAERLGLTGVEFPHEPEHAVQPSWMWGSWAYYAASCMALDRLILREGDE